ncbi:hypothetical protein NMG60_11014352 [Bertholletia excelsa]
MDDFGVLARDFGFKPQGKSAPMAPQKANAGIGSQGMDRCARSSSTSSPFDHNRDGLLFNDVFGGPPKHTSDKNSKSASSVSDFEYDSIFKGSSTSGNDAKNRSSSPSKSTSSSLRYDEDVFTSISSQSNVNQKQSAPFDDLFVNLGRTEKSELKSNNSSRGFDDLLPGFGGSSPTGSDRPIPEHSQAEKTTVNSGASTSHVIENPFVVLESTSTPAVSSFGLFTDPLEEISKLGNYENKNVNGPSVNGGIFDDIDPLDSFRKPAHAFSSEMNNRVKEGSPSRTASSMGGAQTSANTEPIGRSSFKDTESHSKKMHDEKLHESHQPVFDMPSFPAESRRSVGQNASSSCTDNKSTEINCQVGVPPESDEHKEPSNDVWLIVSEIPLFTQPTSAPPPSRPPPPIPARASMSEAGVFDSNSKKMSNDFVPSPSSTQYSQNSKSMQPPIGSQFDELEEFAMGMTTNNFEEYTGINSGEEVYAYSSAAASAAAMKEAMDRAEAKFRHAKEVRERECTKTARTKEPVHLEKDEHAIRDDQEREYREKQEKLDQERQLREEEEREQRRIERERERVKARQAVERATREARERAAAEARERAAAEARLKAQRAAVERVQAEARERAERAAVQRAQAEARERAAAEARERAEKAAAEARERAYAESREKEAREKAAAAAARAEAEARPTAAAAAARMNQQQNDNDLESFFSMGRASSAPRPRATTDPMMDSLFQSKGAAEEARRTSSVSTSSNMRKASSTANIVDDLTSIFGAASSGEFQEVEGESEERRRARLERQQRTQERAAKALAEKNQRDLQIQKEQEERHRIAETLDVEIKRWAAGKEGNLRALLSTLQYVLWPQCGWQPVSLMDLITGAAVKKVYRKATLCIHPDKVQQKGATLQQKYIAEKVFDLLKEAWNKFNSEELF